VATGLQSVIASTVHMEAGDVYSCGRDLLEGLKSNRPDVLLLDMQLPDIGGKELAETILKQYPEVRIIVLTSLEATHHVEEMIQIGCMGYLLKSTADYSRLIQAIEQAYSGEVFLDDTLQKQLLANIMKKRKQGEDTIAQLTRREKEVLRLITDELTNQEIADQLCVSVRTVECHRLSLLHKLGAKNTAGLVKKAIELRLTK
jgi:DNA-binding NarL/FixJ family response regulator